MVGLKPANSPQDESAVANPRRKWSTILKAAPGPTKQRHHFTISRHVSARGGFLFSAPTVRPSLSSPASGMVNHDAPHQLSGRGSSWVTCWRVDRASSY